MINRHLVSSQKPILIRKNEKDKSDQSSRRRHVSSYFPIYHNVKAVVLAHLLRLFRY